MIVEVSGTIAAAEIGCVCRRLRSLLDDDDVRVVFCDVSALGEPDLTTVEILARLQLTTRRAGREIWLIHACDELVDLLALAGLSAALPLSVGVHFQDRRQFEEWKQSGGVEEKSDTGDSTV